MTMHMRAITGALLTLLAALALAITTGGCGSSTATLDPVAQAADVTSQSGGAHIAISAQASGGGLPSGFSLSGSGFFNYDRHEGQLTMNISGVPASVGTNLPPGGVQMEELFTSSSAYIGSSVLDGKLPNGARWMKLDLSRFSQALGLSPGQLTGGQSNPAQMLEYLKASGGSVTVVGHESVRGVQTTRYRGTIDLRKAAEVLPSSNRSQLQAAMQKVIEETGASGYPVEVWVDGDRRVRRMTMEIPLTLEGQQRVQMSVTVELFAFGPTPTVTPPSEGEVYDATQAALSGLQALNGSS